MSNDIQDDLFDEYNARTDFIQKYVFPGGMLPSPSALQAEIARAEARLNGRSWRFFTENPAWDGKAAQAYRACFN